MRILNHRGRGTNYSAMFQQSNIQLPEQLTFQPTICIYYPSYKSCCGPKNRQFLLTSDLQIIATCKQENLKDRIDAWLYSQDEYALKGSQRSAHYSSTFVGKMVKCCWSDGQFLLVGWSTFLVDCSIFVGRMFNFCWSDGHLLLVRWSTFSGRMFNFCRSDGQLLLVRWSTFVGRMFNCCWSDDHILLVRWSTFRLGNVRLGYNQGQLLGYFWLSYLGLTVRLHRVCGVWIVHMVAEDVRFSELSH